MANGEKKERKSFQEKLVGAKISLMIGQRLGLDSKIQEAKSEIKAVCDEEFGSEEGESKERYSLRRDCAALYAQEDFDSIVNRVEEHVEAPAEQVFEALAPFLKSK